MKYLLPLLFSLGAFFAFRHLQADLDARLPGLADVAKKTRPVAKGLERRAERLAARGDTVAAMERLYRAGKLDLTELRQTVGRAAANDPLATWDWIEAQDFTTSDRAQLLQEAARVWFDKDPEQTMARISGCGYLESTTLACSLLGKLLSADPGQRANLIAHLDGVMDLAGKNRSSIQLPPATEEGGRLLLSLPEGPGREALIEDFANRWLEADPSRAKGWLENLPGETRTRVMEDFAEKILHPHRMAGPGAKQVAMEWLSHEASGASQAKIGPLLAATMAKDDPAAAMEWASSHLAAAPLAEATGKIVVELYGLDPDAARRMVEELPPGNLRNLSAYDVAEKWLASEPAAAAAWWMAQVKGSIAESDYFAHGGNRLAQQWVKTDPASYRAFLATPPSGEIPLAMVFAGVSELVASDKAATFDWISTLPKERRNEVIKIAYQGWSSQAPADAASAFDARPDLATADAARQIAVSWYRKDAKAATGWIATLPWGGTREAALAGVKKVADLEASLGKTSPEELRVLLRN